MIQLSLSVWKYLYSRRCCSSTLTLILLRYGSVSLERGLQMLLRLKAYSLSRREPSQRVAIPRPIHPAAELGFNQTALLKVALASYQDLRLRQVSARRRQIEQACAGVGFRLSMQRKTSSHSKIRSDLKQISAFSSRQSILRLLFSKSLSTTSKAPSYCCSPIKTKARRCYFRSPSDNLTKQLRASPKKLQSMKYCIRERRISWDSCCESCDTYLPGLGTLGAGSRYGFLGGFILMAGLCFIWKYFSARATCFSLAFSWPSLSSTNASN